MRRGVEAEAGAQTRGLPLGIAVRDFCGDVVGGKECVRVAGKKVGLVDAQKIDENDVSVTMIAGWCSPATGVIRRVPRQQG